MARNRFVEPKTVRIYFVDSARHTLAQLQKQTPVNDASIAEAEMNIRDAEIDGDYIDVKAELTAGETHKVFSDIVKTARSGEAWELEPELVGITRIMQYLKGWSFTQDDVPVPITEGALRQLDVDTMREINNALDWHEENVEAARAARKNGRGIGSASPAISPLPSDAIGVSSGSEI